MNRVAQNLFRLFFSDTSLYLYISFSLMGIIGLSIIQMKQNNIVVPDGVQGEFRPYVRNFIKESKKHTLPKEFGERMEHLTVKFGFPSRLDDEHDFVGWCEINTTTIIIEKDTWNTYAEGSRQSLIDHELGHCILERHHRPFLAEGNHPVSVMFPRVLPSDYYDKHKDRLYPELFQYSRSNKLRLEHEIFTKTWNLEIQEKFKTVAEYLRFVESEMNGDKYQPWPEKQTQVIQFETADIIIADPKKSSRHGK